MRYNLQRFILSTFLIGVIAAFASLSVNAQLSGEYYIPQGEHPAGFATLSAAINAINNDGADDAVTFFITDDLDESGNDLEITAELTEGTQLTIKPAPETTPTITLTSNAAGATAGAGFGFNFAAWVTIDGSNEEDGDSRDLTFALDDRDGDDVNISFGFYVHGGSINITIKNINLLIAHEVDDAPGKLGRVGQGVRIRRVDDVAVPQNTRVENSQIGERDKMFTNGVVDWGQSEDNPNLNAQIINNDIYAAFRGITTIWSANPSYSYNRIHVTGDAVSSWYSGIYLPGIIGATIAGNEIMLYGATNATGAQISGILLNTNRTLLNIYNNMISTVDDEFHNQDVDGNEVTDHKLFGILSHRTGDPSTTYNLYHNTIRLGDVGQTGRAAPIGWDEDVDAANCVYDIQNNILINEADHGSAYALHWNVTLTDNGEINSDYNNLYAPDANVGFWVNAANATLADWQGASGRDENSISIPVNFVSQNNLRLAEENTDLIVTNAISPVFFDIDGEDRDPSGVYIGAHEYIEPVSVPPTPGEIAESYSLSQNYPNPFNPATNIRFNLPVDGQVTLKVYSVTGQLVETIVNEYKMAGEYTVTFDAGHLSSGVYIYRITAGEFVESKRMMLVK